MRGCERCDVAACEMFSRYGLLFYLGKKGAILVAVFVQSQWNALQPAVNRWQIAV